MYKIAVCIPTFKRPIMLKKCITSVIENNFNKDLISNVDIIIVDNDADKTAEPIVSELKETVPANFELNYFNYPVKGLSNVRNELLNRAIEHSVDYIIGIDDDEYASAEWINEMVLTASINNADCAVGPAIPIMEVEVPKSISYHFNYHKLSNGKQIQFLETNNYLLKIDFILQHKLNFDDRFNFTGGEDNQFGIEALKKGAKICWAANAPIYETIPAKRASVNWLIKRNYRSAITFTYSLILEKEYLKVFKKVMASIAYMILSIFSLIFMLSNSKYKYWGIIKIATAFGGFASLFNLKFYEYHQDLKATR
jgi:succinoglycan biosynthesis protein ExoM